MQRREASQPRSTRPRRRWLRWVSALLVVALGAGIFYLTRPATLAALILPVASRAVGGEVTASRIAMGGLNSIVVSDLAVRAPGWEAPADELARVDRLEIRFALLPLLLGDFRLRSIHANRVDLRLAESTEHQGQFSLASLAPEASEGGGAPQRPDEISIDELVVENGVVGRTGYRKLGDLVFQGRLVPDADDDSALRFMLTGRPDSKGRLSVGSIAGRIDPEELSVSVAADALVIDGRELAVAPIAVRAWMSRLGITGTIPRARFDYAPGKEPSAEIDLRGAGMNLPVDALSGGAFENAWSGFANGKAVDLVSTPRMTLHKGTLRLERNELRFDRVEGELGADEPDADGAPSRVIPLPFVGSFRVRAPVEVLPPFEWDNRDSWFEAAARIAPFAIELEIPSFASPEPKPGAPDTLQLPRAATKVLADFNITSWAIRVQTAISRDDPTPEGVPGELHSTGSLVLERGSGAFEQFPYGLEDVKATITFEDDNLNIEHLEGSGGQGATVAIAGRLDGLSKGALIDLRITCPDAAIDDRLFAAFEDAPREALELLFDARAAKQLGEAGLLPDATHLVSQRQELSRLGDDESLKPLKERLARSNDAGPFALGGRCAFEIRVFSEAGWGKPVEVTGDVHVRNAGLLFGRFPYPLRLKEGSFRVLDEAIEIAPGGISAITPAGGILTVSGKVEIRRKPDKSRGMEPAIHIADRLDALNPALLAAIPHSGDDMPAGWPGVSLAPAGELLSSLGLRGGIELAGDITSDEAGNETFAFDIEFKNGVAAPDAAGRARLAEDGLPWPPEFTLEDCSASLKLTPQRVTIANCIGRAGTGSITASGSAELEGPGRVIEIGFDELPIGRAFEGYLATESQEAAARFARYAPTGAISGSVRRVVDQDGSITDGRLVPSSIEVTLDGSRVRGECIAGYIGVDREGLLASSLEFRLKEGDADDGILRLSGRMSGAQGADLPLDAQLSGTRVESPIVRELLGSRSKGTLELLRSRAARGVFDARYEGARGGQDERFTIAPRTLAVGQPDARVEFAFAEGDTIRGDARGVDFDLHAALTGNHSGTLAVKGSYQSGADNRLNASLKLAAARLTPALREQLPPPLDLAARTQDLVTTRAFDLDLPDLSLRWPESGSAASPDVYQLRGTARLRGAEFSAGTRFSDLDGDIPMRFRYEPRGTTPIDFSATLDATSGRVFDRPIGATKVTLQTASGGDTLDIAAAGDLAYGRFDLNASVDFAKHLYDARVRAVDVDYEVLRAAQPMAASTVRTQSRIAGVVRLKGSTTGSVDTRTGSGRLAIRNATLASMPVAMRVLQMTQLMLPMSSTISATDAEFTVRGNAAEVSKARLMAGTIELEGSGSVDIPTFGVGLRLFAKGTVPIVSEVIGGVTSKIFAIDVAGTLFEPKASLAPLPGMTDAPTPQVDPTPAKPADAPASAAPGAGQSAETVPNPPK